MRWYITVAAVRQWMQIADYPNTEKAFDQAAKQLDEISQGARLKKDGIVQQWEVKTALRDRVARIELYVSTAARPEGPLPQLIRVRYKGGSRSGKRKKKD